MSWRCRCAQATTAIDSIVRYQPSPGWV
jgi:hypothetical protein